MFRTTPRSVPAADCSGWTWHREQLLFVNDARIPLDNNYGERLIRDPAVGRKNYYGSGSEWSGRLAMRLFSIFATLKLWNINPCRWLML